MANIVLFLSFFQMLELQDYLSFLKTTAGEAEVNWRLRKWCKWSSEEREKWNLEKKSKKTEVGEHFYHIKSKLTTNLWNTYKYIYL